jgi:DHA1 family multidrug resistance protein-like MFS transporter
MLNGQSRRIYIELVATGALAYTSYAMCRSPLLPLFARDLGAGPEMVGVVVAASTITGIAVKMPAGALSDVFGRRALLISGAAVFAFAPFAYLAVASLFWLLALRFVHGNATAIFGPVASATVSDLAPRNRRGAWLSVYSTMQAAGQAGGALLAASLIANGDFDRAFIASGVIGAGALVLAWRQPPRVNLAVGNEAWWRRLHSGLSEILRDRRILIVSGVQAALLLVSGSLAAFLPLFAKDALGLTTIDIGWIFAGQTTSTLIARPIFGAASDRWGRRALIVSGLAACSGAFGLVAMATDFTTLAVAVVLYGAALAVATSATSALVTDLSRQARYGAAHGVFGTIYDVGDAAGPIVAGLLVAALGYREMFFLNAGWALLLAVVFLAVPVAFQHDS